MRLIVYLNNRTELLKHEAQQLQHLLPVEIINLDKNPQIAQQEQVWVTPTVVLEDGNAQQRFSFFDLQELEFRIGRLLEHTDAPLDEAA